MSEDDESALIEMLLVQRARLDVLERVVADFIATANLPLAKALEDQLRSYNEHGLTSPDEARADRLRRADMAAILLADVFAQVLVKRK